MKFKHLEVPAQWKEYFTKYPHGFTIWEAVCDWTSKVDVMIDYLNLTSGQIEHLMEQVLPENVENVLNEWYLSGRLADLINIDLLNRKVDQTELDLRGVNVKKYGAIGDGVTDDSEAFQIAVNNHDVVFVPAGVYKVKDVDINNFDHKTIYGQPGAILKPHKRFNVYNIPKRMFDVKNGNKFIFRGLTIQSDQDQDQVGSLTFYNEAILEVNNVKNVLIDNNHFKDVFVDHVPQYREYGENAAAVLAIKNCDMVISNNIFENLHGDEWVHNITNTSDFAMGKAVYINNIWRNGYKGNGSMCSHTGGEVQFINNHLSDFTYGGSCANICANDILVECNTFKDLDVKHVIDTTEGSEAKNNSVTILNNFFDTPDAYQCVACDTKYLDVKGNIFKGYTSIYARIMHRPNTHTHLQPGNDTRYGEYSISDNRIIRTNDGEKWDTAHYAGSVGLNAAGRDLAQGWETFVKVLNIKNNVFDITENTIGATVIYINTLVDEINIDGNLFNYFGKFPKSVSSFYKSYILKTFYQGSNSEKMRIINNVFANVKNHDLTGLRILGSRENPSDVGAGVSFNHSWANNVSLAHELVAETTLPYSSPLDAGIKIWGNNIGIREGGS